MPGIFELTDIPASVTRKSTTDISEKQLSGQNPFVAKNYLRKPTEVAPVAPTNSPTQTSLLKEVLKSANALDTLIDKAAGVLGATMPHKTPIAAICIESHLAHASMVSQLLSVPKKPLPHKRAHSFKRMGGKVNLRLYALEQEIENAELDKTRAALRSPKRRLSIYEEPNIAAVALREGFNGILFNPSASLPTSFNNSRQETALLRERELYEAHKTAERAEPPASPEFDSSSPRATTPNETIETQPISPITGIVGYQKNMSSFTTSAAVVKEDGAFEFTVQHHALIPKFTREEFAAEIKDVINASKCILSAVDNELNTTYISLSKTEKFDHTQLVAELKKPANQNHRKNYDEAYRTYAGNINEAIQSLTNTKKIFEEHSRVQLDILKKCQNDVEALHKRIHSCKEDDSKILRQLQKETGTVNTTINTLEHEITALEKRHKPIIGKLLKRTHECNVPENIKRSPLFEQDVSDARRYIKQNKDLSTTRVLLEAKIATLKNDLAEKNTYLQKLVGHEREFEKNAGTASKILGDLEKARNQLENEQENYKNEIVTISTEIAAQEKRLGNIPTAKKDFDAEMGPHPMDSNALPHSRPQKIEKLVVPVKPENEINASNLDDEKKRIRKHINFLKQHIDALISNPSQFSEKTHKMTYSRVVEKYFETGQDNIAIPEAETKLKNLQEKLKKLGGVKLEGVKNDCEKTVSLPSLATTGMFAHHPQCTPPMTARTPHPPSQEKVGRYKPAVPPSSENRAPTNTRIVRFR